MDIRNIYLKSSALLELRAGRLVVELRAGRLVVVRRCPLSTDRPTVTKHFFLQIYIRLLQ